MSGEATQVDFSSAAGRYPATEKFWNWPNSITMVRIAVVPVLFLLPFFAESRLACQVFAWFFIVAAASDVLDGWLARRGAQVTKIGKLLDPLADKLLVTTALIMVLAAGHLERWAAVMVVVIVGRELAVTGLRSIASAHGHVVAAAWTGKLKAVVQNFAIAALLFHFETFGLPAHEVGLVLLSLATVLTLWSGYLYFSDYFGWGRSSTGPVAESEDAAA